jgi:protein-tyrosine sulfotransferase
LAAYTSESRHVVMGGAPRSGTTLLRKLLDRHPELCSGAETKLFVPAAFNLAWLARAYELHQAELEAMVAAAPSQAAFVDAFAARVTAAAGKARWAEKTPQNILHLDWILRHFPAASVIHIVRDGRDVVCSMREHPDWRWVDGAWQKVLVPRSVEWYAQRWLDDTAAGMAWRRDQRYVEVRYEDLVADPARAMREVCDAIGATVDVTWLAGLADDSHGRAETVGAAPGRPDYEGAVSAVSVGRWRTDLDADEQRLVTRLCGSRLRELGYPAS